MRPPPPAGIPQTLILCALAARNQWPSAPCVWPSAHLHDELRACGCPNLLTGIELPHALRVGTADLLRVRQIFAKHPTPAQRAAFPSQLLMEQTPPAHRKKHGEFYTPSWLVERVLRQTGWKGSTETLTDPTCGAGAFLAHAALTLRSHHDLTAAAGRISGSDLNPLAVLAARVACLCAVADLLEPAQPFEPNIHVADILTKEPSSRADVLVGNPPWIRFSDLDAETQQRVAERAQSYDLIPKAFHGGSGLDVSAVFTYQMIDRWLRDGGRAALVLPSSLLRSASSERFRRFHLPDGTPFGLDYVADFGAMRIFPGATNRTAVLGWTKGSEGPDLIEARLFREEGNGKASSARFVGADRRIACFEHGAGDVFALEGATTGARGRKGVTTDLNGAYFVRVLGPGSAPHLAHVANDVVTRGKQVPKHAFDVETSLLFPLLKGSKQIRPFRVEPTELAVIVPNRRVTGVDGELVFRATHPAAFAHFAWIEQQMDGALSKRSTYRRMLARHAPFFAVYNVGDYTFAPFKVVWAEIARSLVAGVATSDELAHGWGGKVLVPDHKVYFASFDEPAPALFLCSLLNSTVVRTYVDAITEKLQVGALLDRVRLPAFDASDPNHQQLTRLATEASTRFDAEMQTRIDRACVPVLR